MPNAFEIAAEKLEEIQERGGERTIDVLPTGYYPVRLTVEESGVTQLREEYDEATGVTNVKGGVPWINLHGVVTAGPYEGAEVQRRVYFSPGQDGKNMGYMHAMAKAVTRQKPQYALLGKFGFEFSDDAGADEVAEEFRRGWSNMTPDERVDFMMPYMRVQDWDGVECIAKINCKLNKWKDRTSGEQREAWQSEFGGFFATNDRDKGMKWVQETQFKLHQKNLDEQLAQEG